MAQPYANTYLDQFPKDKMEQLSSFVAFVAGAFTLVLVGLTLLDSEQFLTFEVTSGTTAIFWIGTFGAIYRIARGGSTQENQVADPAFYLGHVEHFTHYKPESWIDRLHTDEVRAEFAKLYQPKVLIFAEEILSMVITPFLLIFRLPNCSERIVDFFREFSIVVDGVGVTCSYSMFPFNKGTQNRANNIPSSQPGGARAHDADTDVRGDYFTAKDNKMLASYYGFMDTYASPSGRGQSNRHPGRGPFHPPPQFPNAFGNISQIALPGDLMHARGPSIGPTGRQPRHLQRRPPKGPARDEPMSSTLLDPHHQPSASMRGSPRGASNGRYQSRLHSVASPTGHAGTRIEEESSIGDSWRTSRLAQDDEEEEDEASSAGRGGVLQLLQQFSKAQAEGRGAGVGV